VDAARQVRRTPPAATAGVWHVACGADRAILKVVRDGGAESRWPATRDPRDPYYWRREICVYESGIAAELGAPRARAVVERPDGSVALWLDDAGEPPAWTAGGLGAVARRLGAAQAAPPPDREWLARGFLRRYLVLHGVEPDEQVLGALDAAEQTLCHNDFHPGNLLGAEADVVVDWAYCGLGAFGLDAGVLVADGIADEAFPAEEADAVAAAVWDGYVEGLGGGRDLDAVRFAFTRGTRLRLSWLPRGERPSWDATIDFLERLASVG
jgi:hypothetical protein